MNKILLVEDDATIVEGLRTAFTFHNFELIAGQNSEEGYKLFSEEDPDLIILDIMLPGIDGYELCRKIRSQDQQVPIIMLTAKSQESDKLLGFELGADDYLTKPFSAKELIARVRAVLKRVGKTNKNKGEVKLGDACIYLEQFIIKRENSEYKLSPKEKQILKLLLDNPGTVISRNRIIDEVWGDEYFPSPKTIDNFIVKLRGKIEKDAKNPQYILTIHGAGYKLKP